MPSITKDSAGLNQVFHLHPIQEEHPTRVTHSLSLFFSSQGFRTAPGTYEEIGYTRSLTALFGTLKDDFSLFFKKN